MNQTLEDPHRGARGGAEVQLEVLADAESAGARAARQIAADARAAVAERGRFSLALSGGSTPEPMLRQLAEQDVPWPRVHVFQVDERVAPTGDADRNLTQLRASLAAAGPLAEEQLHAMPVEAPDLAAAALLYARTLRAIAGAPPVLDLVHLGLGADGHTASLLPGDPVLDVGDADVALTARAHAGRRRMTLTYPLLARARRILWLVTGEAKAEMLARLCAADTRIPAGRVCRERALVLADRGAAARSMAFVRARGG
ncbi:MAG: 6-phosphogluconolactonase [Deltaproteobacteria bacterium]|nr:MAG: 6-phosphogluconolactonase [Deltaproteobacteria bacterium]